MPYISITSAQLEALQELDKGHGLRAHEGADRALTVDVFLNDINGHHRQTNVLPGGQITDLVASRTWR